MSFFVICMIQILVVTIYCFKYINYSFYNKKTINYYMKRNTINTINTINFIYFK